MAQRIGIQALLDASDFVEGLHEYVEGLKQAENQTDRFATQAAGPASQGINAFSQIAIGALRAIGEAAVHMAAEAIRAIGDLGAELISGAAEAENIETRLGVVIRAMGDATDLTLEQANDLADANRDLFQGNDELARSVIQVGLSMGTVSADEMPTFLQQVADLAAVTGTDAPTAARLFAQAYEDPISTLRRFRAQNIQVDNATRDTIKRLVEQGRTEEAAALLMERVAQSTAGAAEAMADTTEGRFRIFTEHLRDIGEDTAAGFLAAFDEPLQQLAPVVEGLMGQIGTILSDPEITQGFQDVVLEVVGLIEEFGPDVVQGFGDLVTGALDLFQAIREGPDENSPVMKFLQRMGEWWQENGPGITQTAQNLFGRMRETIGQVIDKIRPFVERVLVQLADWFEENGPLIQLYLKQGAERFAAFFQAIGDAWAIVEPLLQGIIDLILGWVTLIMQIFTGDWAAAWETAKQMVADAWTAIEGAIAAFADWVAGWFGTTWQGIKDQWAQNWEDFKLLVGLVWESIKTGIAEKAAEIATALGEWAAGLVILVADRVADFIQAGKDLISGLWQGIADKIQWLKDRVREGIQGVVDLVRGLLGTGSPSKVFMEIGGDLMLGMGQGIQQAAHIPAGAMQTAAATVTAGAMTTYNVNRSRTTNVNLDFDANYARTQSPVTVRDDITAILAQARR